MGEWEGIHKVVLSLSWYQDGDEMCLYLLSSLFCVDGGAFLFVTVVIF